MSKSVYIATMENASGKSVITLGLMQMLLGKVAKVGYFKPIISDNEGGSSDNHIRTVCRYFELGNDCSSSYLFTKNEVLDLKHRGELNKVLDACIAKYKELEKTYDFILVEGTDFSGEGTATELEINTDIAKNLGIPVIIVESGVGKSMEDFVNNLMAAYDLFRENDTKVISVVANKVQEENIQWVKEELRKRLPDDVLVHAIPLIKELAIPSIKEIKDTLNAEVLFGDEAMNNPVEHTIVGAMQLRHFLQHLRENTLVVTPGDRADLILGSLQAHLSNRYPKLSGIVLSGGVKPEPSIMELIDGLTQTVPILAVSGNTYQTANLVSSVKPKIYADNRSKIERSLRVFDTYMNEPKLAESLITFTPEGITPRMFQYNLIQRAKEHKKHIVLPEGNDLRILKAAARIARMDIAELTVLGKKEEVEKMVKENHIDFNFDKIHILNHVESPQFEDYVHTLYELRKHKNLNLAMAEDKMRNVSYYGTMMVYKGDADGMVSGAAHTTQHTILPALEFIKTKPGVHIVSSIFFMMLEDRVSVMGDCAINPNPTAEELAEIAISSADSSRAFGIEPRMAMLSYSSGTSGVGSDVDKVRKATEIVREKRPDILIEGPIQYDAAVDPEVGRKKLPGSPVAGRANVLIFPDLNTGNNTYKAIQRETGATAIGPMLQGLKKPINDLSRGCTVDDIFNTIIITAIQAQGL